ncbi:lipoate--protein ligase family protein [Amphibacillus sp. Q70]|uniref:lipoate--protein ligase family protein n=1 Tax=Amphibacillus sp. Q70 TaxID=3453416 RepID=UPI003F86AA5D
MDNWRDIFSDNNVRFIDHRSNDLKIWESFAVDDALAESIHNGESTTTIRVWSHPEAVVLGIADSRLPHLTDASQWLIEQGFNPVVRNSGGLAVALDEGVLNLSLLIKDENSVGIHEAYQKMVLLIQALLADWTDKIEAFEVMGSYCPGDYDLSIGGKKFAGISQRRIRNGIAIQIYLSITADYQMRARLIRDFYQIGIQDEDTRFTYPNVDPNTMEALETLIGEPIGVDDVIVKLKETLIEAGIDIKHGQLKDTELETFKKRRKQMIDRNERALGNLFVK